MRTARVLVAVIALAALAAGGRTFSAFTKTTSNANDRILPARIFPHDRTVPAFAVSDASGAANDESAPLAYADALILNTSNAATTFAANRYVDVELAGLVPAALTPSTVTAEIDFADNNADANQSCIYFESRRISTDAVLNTWGSPAAPLACNSGTIPTPVTQPLSAVTSAAIANDLKLRIYFKDAGANAARLSRVVVRFVALGKTFTLYPVSIVDALDTTPATTPWSLATADSSSWFNSTAWPASFNAAKYVSFGFPATVPGSATVSASSLEFRWNSFSGTQCMYFEVYDGSTLLATHGSTGTPYCANSATYATTTVSLPEISTADRANNATAKMYVWGSSFTGFDVVALHHTYQLGPTGCVDAGTQRVEATRDTFADQFSAVFQGGAPDLKVRSDTTKNKRAFMWFPLPSVGSGCSLTAATLRLNENTSGGSRTVALDRVTGAWTEGGLNWTNLPTSAGTTVTDGTAATGWHQWTVTSMVQAMYAGTNNGFVLQDTSEGAAVGVEQKYDSLEKLNGNPPELLLTYG